VSNKRREKMERGETKGEVYKVGRPVGRLSRRKTGRKKWARPRNK